MNGEYTEIRGSTEQFDPELTAEVRAEIRRLSLDDKFKFSCHKALSCFNTCCSDTNIFLTPYDVLRMRRSLELSSGEFLQKYTVALLGDEGLPAVVLRMMDDENKSCPFVTPDGCRIYQNRPWSCRMYPVFPDSSKEEEFLIEEKPLCLAFKEGKKWTIEEWRKDQGIGIYDKMNESYKEITFNDYFEKGNKLDSGKAKIIYMSCYDLDEFKRFLFETRFFDIYTVEKDVIEKMKEEDDELLSFGYRWVRFNLFGEDTLRPKDKVLDEFMQTKRDELGLRI